MTSHCPAAATTLALVLLSGAVLAGCSSYAPAPPDPESAAVVRTDGERCVRLTPLAGGATHVLTAECSGQGTINHFVETTAQRDGAEIGTELHCPGSMRHDVPAAKGSKLTLRIRLVDKNHVGYVQLVEKQG